MKRSRNTPKGFALILAVLVAALAAAVTAFAAWRYQVHLREAELRRDSAQAEQVIRSSITLGKTLLIDDARNDQQQYGHPYDDLGEAWNHPIQDLDVEQGKVSGKLEDAQSRFNLNSLLVNNDVDPTQYTAFIKLLTNLQLNPALAITLADWLDSNSETRPGGAEDMEYLAMDKPYRAGNGQLISVDELMFVKGYTPPIIALLRNYVVALPVATKVNINTVTQPEIVSALVPGLTSSDAKAVMPAYTQKPFNTTADFIAALPETVRENLNNIPNATQDLAIDTASSYFTICLDVNYGRIDWQEQALLRRDNNSGTVIWRRRMLDAQCRHMIAPTITENSAGG